MDRFHALFSFATYINYIIYQAVGCSVTSQTHNISPNSTEVAVSAGIDATKGIRFQNKGDSNLEIYIVASLQDSPTQPKNVLPQETVIVSATDISNGQYNVLVVRNISNLVGKYEVEVLEEVV